MASFYATTTRLLEVLFPKARSSNDANPDVRRVGHLANEIELSAAKIEVTRVFVSCLKAANVADHASLMFLLHKYHCPAWTCCAGSTTSSPSSRWPPTAAT